MSAYQVGTETYIEGMRFDVGPMDDKGMDDQKENSEFGGSGEEPGVSD